MSRGRLIFATGRATHWAGGVRHPQGICLAGWPCCTSGRRAEHIRQLGEMTLEPARVSCKRCLAKMRRSPELAAKLDASRERDAARDEGMTSPDRALQDGGRGEDDA